MTMEAHEIKFNNFVWLFFKLCPLCGLRKSQIKVLRAEHKLKFYMQVHFSKVKIDITLKLHTNIWDDKAS